MYYWPCSKKLLYCYFQKYLILYIIQALGWLFITKVIFRNKRVPTIVSYIYLKFKVICYMLTLRTLVFII